jgi:radical SAM-linked protein
MGRNVKVNVSVSTHVPKPHTPFQWCAMDSLPEIERKQALLRDAVRRVRGLGLKLHDAPTSVLEGILARGDRRLADVIERAFLGGARFDSWDDHLRLDLWEEALAHFALDTRPFLGTIAVDARLPWDHLDVGLEEGFLAREYRKALAGRASPPCGKVAGAFIHATNAEDAAAEQRRLVCYDCGIACDLGKMKQERLVYLRKLGAHERPKPLAAAAEQSESMPDAPARARRRLSRPEGQRPVRPGGAPRRFRLRFEKVGPAALLGHLDLGRELPRAIRRAGVRLRYSEGFHPKPDLSFGPALSLGVASLDEYVDVKLIDAPSPEELVARLASVTAAGLRFVSAVPLVAEDPAVSSVVTGARYVIALAETVVAEHGGHAALAERIAALLAKSEAKLRRDISGVGKIVDVRRFLQTLAFGGDLASDQLRAAGIVGRAQPLELTLAISPAGSAKVSEVVEALFGQAVPHLAVRVALLAGAGTPLDLELFRRVPPTQRAEALVSA